MYKVGNNGKSHDKNNQITVDNYKKIITWKNYIEELFKNGSRSKIG